MEVNLPEVIVNIIGSRYPRGEPEVLCSYSFDDYSMDSVEAATCVVLEAVRKMTDAGDIVLEPRVEARVWSREGIRVSLNLSADTMRRIAAGSASFDLDLQQINDHQDIDGGVTEFDIVELRDPRPELVTLFVGNSPETGKECILARSCRDIYTMDGLQKCIHETIELARKGAEGEIESWRPQIGVRLSSERGIRPSIYLSADVIKEVSSLGASLDFDPYV